VIDMSTQAVDMQQTGSGYVRYCRVESWLDGELLHDDVPIVSGREEVDRSARVQERVTVIVPLEAAGYRWAPDGPKHPLGAFGQRLRIMLGVGLAGDAVEWVQRGEYVVQSADPRGRQVNVEAVGLMALVDEARLVAPYQPTGTLASTLRGLVEPALTVVFDAGLTDRAVPAGINYDEDRLGAVQELLDAWPAQAAVSNDGYLVVSPVTIPSTTKVLSSQTTIEMNGSSSRDNAFNCVVARGTASDGGQVQGAAYEYGTGPYRFGGPFNPLPVPQFFASPLLTTVSACKAAATTRLQKILRERSASYEVSVPPQNYLQVGDRVAVGAQDQDGVDGTVERLSLPLLAGDGMMTLTVVEIPS
jgi:hypothetical protein